MPKTTSRAFNEVFMPEPGEGVRVAMPPSSTGAFGFSCAFWLLQRSIKDWLITMHPEYT